MGCDIHGYWEVKDHTGNWMAFENINEIRNYMWFGIIAGVRGGPDIGTANRGIPPDPSGAYQDMLDDCGDDLHSHTWLTPKEVAEACQELNNRMIEAYNDPHPEPYEDVPGLDTTLRRILPHSLADWPWFGNLKDLMMPGAELNESLRLVVCFDS